MFETGSSRTFAGLSGPLDGLWWLAGVVLLVAVVVYHLWRRRRTRLHASAKFFARNFLRPGYVEITITNPGPHPARLDALMLADASGHTADGTPARDQQGRPVTALEAPGTALVFRVGYALKGPGSVLPFHGRQGQPVPWVNGWCTRVGGGGKPIAIDGLVQALQKLHQDKQVHDAVEARRNGDGAPHSAAAAGTPSHTGRARAHTPAPGSHSRVAADKRRRSKRRKTGKK